MGLKGLDKYLTTEPDNGFIGFVEKMGKNKR